jgi:hypothetical protein
LLAGADAAPDTAEVGAAGGRGPRGAGAGTGADDAGSVAAGSAPKAKVDLLAGADAAPDTAEVGAAGGRGPRENGTAGAGAGTGADDDADSVAAGSAPKAKVDLLAGADAAPDTAEVGAAGGRDPRENGTAGAGAGTGTGDAPVAAAAAAARVAAGVAAGSAPKAKVDLLASADSAKGALGTTARGRKE